MKSKIQKNQILIKGVTTSILVIMILSCLAVVKPNIVMAEEATEDVDDLGFETVKSEESELDYIGTDSELQSISAELKELKEQIAKMASYSEIEYNAFMKELKNSTTITVDNELKLRALSIYVAESYDDPELSNEEKGCKGKTINMIKNIELTSTEEWEPIGSSEKPFKGTFNGYGHTISGMLITKQNNNVGLFGYVDGGVIKNIKISKNCTINIPLDIENDRNDLVSKTVAKYAYLGAIVGYAKNTSIYNCTNGADVLGGSVVGGIVGCLYNGTIKDCINTGSVKGLANIGGIAGRVYGTNTNTESYASVQRSKNTGTIFGVVTDVGGIVGTLKGNARIYKSENDGQVSTNTAPKALKVNGKIETVNPQNVGGIVGATGGTDQTNSKNITTRIMLSINKGKVYGYTDIGGIVGQLGNVSGGYSLATDCINYTNDIKGYKVNEVNESTVYVGKIAGWVGSNSKYQEGRVYNCYYQITSDNDKGTKSHWALNTQIKSDKDLIRAIGGYTGPTSGSNFKGNNNSWKFTKYKENYYFQGRMYIVNSGELEADGYTVYYKTAKAKNTWFSRKNNTDPSTNGKGAGEITIDSDGKTPSPNYQYWLYRISNSLEFKGTECVIDKTSPTADTVKVATASKFDIAVPGDKILFSVKFNENVRHNRDLVLNFKIGTKAKTATFLGIDNNVARFEYIVQKDEGITETDSATNEDYLVNSITLSQTVIDTFVNYKTYSNTALNQEGSVIVMSGDKDSPNALYFKNGSEIKDGTLSTTLNTTYKFYEGNYINEKDKLFYNKNNFKVKVNINKVLTSATNSSDSIKYQLHVKLRDIDEEVIIDASNVITKTSSTWIYFNGKTELSKKEFDSKSIEEIYVTTDKDINVAVGVNKLIKFKLNRDNTKRDKINRIYIDTKAPSFTAEYSTKEKYTVGDQINIKLTSSEELSSGKDLSLKVKFDKSDGKGNVKLISGPTKNADNKNKTELIYQYIVQDGDNGELSISTSGTIQDLALNETDLSKSAYNYSGKYADTTAPKVNITAKNGTQNIENITNANTITYTFDWSEEVTEFEAKDITIIGGKIKEDTTLVQDTIDKTKYTLEVIPNVAAGNEGQVQVIIEANVCKDIVGLGNLRTESTIKVDKKAPTLVSYNVNKSSDGAKIIVEAIFDEAIGTAHIDDIELKFAGNTAYGTVTEATINSNDKRVVTYTYYISGADEGTPTITLKTNTVKDIAGNANSRAYTLENKDIVLEKCVIKIGSDEYSFSKNNIAITNFANPTYFKAGDKITVTNSKKTYEYTIEAGKYDNNSYMKYMKLTDPSTANFSKTSITGSIDISVANIYFDTTAPRVNLSTDIESVENNIYLKGKEIILISTTTEPVSTNNADLIIPEINISFSKSGLGKYNYQGEYATTGNAKYLEAINNADGTISWKYKYVIEQGDEGTIEIAYLSGKIKDLAGNETDIGRIYRLDNPSNSYSPINEFKGIHITDIKFYKNSSCTQPIDPIENTKQTDDFYIKVTLDGALYTGINTTINTNTAPILYLNDNIETTPQSVTGGKELVYKYNKNSVNYLTKVEYITLKNEKTILYNTADLVSNAEGIAKNKKYSYETDNFYLDPMGVSSSIDSKNIYADTTAPTVNITAKKLEGTTTDISNNVTNADTLEYTFTWSEQVAGFEPKDITIINGTKGTLSEPSLNSDGTYSYTMNITTNVASGNEGDIQVIVEQSACQDIAGHENVRTESRIRVDKKSPTLNGLEAYVENSNIGLGTNVNDVKEYYKVGETVTVVATFSENIENTTTVPSLVLQFTESGNAKGTIRTGEVDGNKITYTYQITNEDAGTLSVKGFSGKVKDNAGNETKVTKRNLDGDTIIADSVSPTIKAISIIAPDFKYDSLLDGENETKRYGTGSQVKFVIEFDENIYTLVNNKVEKITAATAPKLKIKFGDNVTSKDPIISISESEGAKLTYTYNIESGNNGDLTIVSMGEKDISDIAGNTTSNYALPTAQYYEAQNNGNNISIDGIKADTEAPTVSLKVTNIENGGLTGNNNHYKAGSILTITATTNERAYIKNNENLSNATIEATPLLGINFGGTAAKGTIKCIKVENVNNQTMFTYEYTIANEDNGEIALSFEENKYYDIALNSNSAGIKNSSSKAVIADTTSPNTSHLEGTNDNSYIRDNGNGTYTVKFTEKLYYLNNNTVIALTSSNVVANGPKLTLKETSGEFIEIAPSSINSNGTELIYRANSGLERIGLSTYNKICDVAGNMYNSAVKAVLTLTNISITSPEDKIVTYCAGTEVTIVAKFTKRVTGTVPELKIKFGDNGTERVISSGIKDKDTITYKYTIQDGDNGNLRIVSLNGTGLTGEDGSNYEAPTDIVLTGETITADTIKPIATIKAYTDYKDSSKKAEVSGKTNTQLITYEFTWSEDIKDFDVNDITVINGIKDTFTKINERTYILDVCTSTEGKQVVSIASGVCSDMAKEQGNPNESARINSVEIDYIAPSIRFVTPNGGIYTTSTDTRNENKPEGTATLTARIEINEEVGTFKYRVLKEGSTEEPEYTQLSQINSSDINITMKNVEVGNYVLDVIVTDKAGNERTAQSNKYIVTNSSITITPSTQSITNQDIIANISYADALTENRKAGISGKTQSADSSKVIVTENGTIYAEATDKAGNKVYKVLEIENIDKVAPEGTITYVTNKDKSVTATISFNEENVSITNNNGKNTYVFEENGEFTFEFRDGAGNTNKAKAVVTTIDKIPPKATINYMTNEDGSVTAQISFDEETIITNNDGKNTYVFTKNGEFTFEFKDLAGNTGTAVAKVSTIKEPEKPVEDKTAPTITFNYTSTVATVNTAIGATITTDEDAIISYSWDNKTWTSSEDYVRSQKVVKTPTTAGNYTLYAKAIDKSSNQSTVQSLQFTVVRSEEEIKNPEIIFEDLPIVQVNGVKYVKIPAGITLEDLTSKMNKEALLGKTPEYTKLTEDKKLKTGSEIAINGETKYIVAVKGDINCDGKVTFEDIIKTNGVRLLSNENTLSKAQLIASDINNTGKIEFRDIISINAIRINSTK